MFIRLFLLMSLLPILEIIVLLRVHGSLSSFFGGGQAFVLTVALIVLTGIVGARLAQSQGFKIINKIQGKLAAGEIPSQDMIEGIMILSGGILLLTPGYITDLFGLSFLVPVTRSFIRQKIQAWFQRKADSGEIKVFYSSNINQGSPYGVRRPQPPGDQDNIIDVQPTEEKP